MNIRAATEKDAAQLNKLVTGLSHFFLTGKNQKLPGWLLNNLSLNEFKKRLSDNNFITIICESDNEITGYISVKNRNHIYHLFVSRKHQRKGIAKQLWIKTKILCLSSNYTVRSSLYAVPVYESFGFKKSSDIQTKDNIQFQEMKYSLFGVY